MPVDYGNSETLDEYVSELGILEGLLDEEVYDHVVILGDFNSDIRKPERRFSARLCCFLNDYNLVTAGLGDVDEATRSTWHTMILYTNHGSITFSCQSFSVNVLMDFVFEMGNVSCQTTGQ